MTDQNKKEKKLTLISRIKELILLLNKWRYSRYELDKQAVSQDIYDQYFEELQTLEKLTGFILPESPTKNIGYLSDKKKNIVERKIPMLSLESVSDFNSLKKWENGIKKKLNQEQKEKLSYLVEWKIDGLSLSLIYRNSCLVQLSSRGDGFNGEDLTFNKRIIKNIPLFLGKEICSEKEIEIRGEIFLPKKDFESINEVKKRFSNPRNAASGIIRSFKDSLNYNDKSSLFFCAYSFLGEKFSNQEECLLKLKKLGFTISDFFCFDSLEKIEPFLKEAEKKREELEFESDGLVIKINNYDLYSVLGETNRFPRWAIAFKFSPKEVYTQILDIKTTVTKSGRISYVALLNPVYLQGILIKNVTLHNYSFICEKKIDINDEVVISRSGDVIPRLIQIIKIPGESKTWSPPLFCPNCKSNLVWDKNESFQLCPNENCDQKKISLITHFVSKNGLKVEGISKETIRTLYMANLIRTPVDLFYLKRSDLEFLEGFKQKKIDNLFFSLEKAKSQPHWRLLSAISIPMMSLFRSKKLFDLFPTFKELVMYAKNERDKIEETLGKKCTEEFFLFYEKNENFLKELSFLF